MNRCGNLSCHRIDDHTASCEDCQFLFCTNCSSPAHPEEPDCIKYLEKELKSAHVNQSRAETLKTLKKLREEGNVRVCPKCQMAYQKISGCDHIRCGKCGHNFNYDSRDKRQSGTRSDCRAGVSHHTRAERLLAFFGLYGIFPYRLLETAHEAHAGLG